MGTDPQRTYVPNMIASVDYPTESQLRPHTWRGKPAVYSSYIRAKYQLDTEIKRRKVALACVVIPIRLRLSSRQLASQSASIFGR